DDLLIGTSSGGLIFCQVKRSISLSTSETSDFRSVVTQFVTQYYQSQQQTQGQRPWDRPLDPHRDELVLVCGPESSGRITRDLSTALDRLRALPTGVPLDDAATNQAEQSALSVLVSHSRACWQAIFGAPAIATNLRRLFEL